MKYNEFIEKMQTRVQAVLGDEVTVEMTTVKKVNDILKQGLILKRQNVQTAPAIYLEEFYEKYEEGQTFQKLVHLFIKTYQENEKVIFPDVNVLMDYEKCKNGIVIKLINYQKNKELLKEIPHILFLNLAIIFYYQLSNDKKDHASVTIRNKNLEYWGIQKEILYRDAIENSQKKLPCVIQSMDEIVHTLLEEDQDPEQCKMRQSVENFETHEPEVENQIHRIVERCENQRGKENVPMMLVVSNSAQLFGASCLMYKDMLEKCAKALQKNFYILPSSVHEIILIPDEGNYLEDALLDMVKDVNTSQVRCDEWLADAVYYYDRRKRKTVLCCGE